MVNSIPFIVEQNALGSKMRWGKDCQPHLTSVDLSAPLGGEK